MNEYNELGEKLLRNGSNTLHGRSGKACKTVFNHSMEYSCLPIIRSKKVNWSGACAEMLGYIQGVENSQEFEKLGTVTWSDNANKNNRWLKNPNRKGYGDIGKSYPFRGGEGRGDQLKMVYEKLLKKNDDRRLIIDAWVPELSELSALSPCMFMHQFSLNGDHLSITSFQRSCDVPLGLPYNMIQVWFLLELMAHITGLEPYHATHHLVNCHIYDDQLDQFRNQMERPPIETEEKARLVFNDDVKTLQDVESITNIHDLVEIVDYDLYFPAMKYPFTI